MKHNGKNMTEYDNAKKVMGCNFIGVEELGKIDMMTFKIPDHVPEIPFSRTELERRKDDYLLILGINRFDNGKPVTIREMIKIFGQNPDAMEPCFYNQDWYDKELFIDKEIVDGWYFIRKSVYEDSKAVQPTILSEKYRFPSAISCVYAFFVAWYTLDIKLWFHDFVWCSDVDHNGDRVYVGKYHDVDGVNKNGFSIHRHLELRDCYGCID